MNRRFVVKAGTKLAWADREGAVPKNQLSLVGATSYPCEQERVRVRPESPVKRYAFIVEFAEETDHAPIYLEAKSEAERNAWLAVLPQSPETRRLARAERKQRLAFSGAYAGATEASLLPFGGGSPDSSFASARRTAIFSSGGSSIFSSAGSAMSAEL